MMGCVSVTYGETELGFEPLPHAKVLACYSLHFEIFHYISSPQRGKNLSAVRTKYFAKDKTKFVIPRTFVTQAQWLINNLSVSFMSLMEALMLPFEIVGE
ncbi:hypothetical protein VNO80_15659 [Phaseolus coccineus]|uniref:Uncharacterized protein n=1 Tax=Phaseolus coccineus TaxID=3886 RepID=A0AAN9R770_PHACN